MENVLAWIIIGAVLVVYFMLPVPRYRSVADAVSAGVISGRIKQAERNMARCKALRAQLQIMMDRKASFSEIEHFARKAGLIP